MPGGDVKRNFTRTVEDFRCVECSASIRGDGYTNHCPRCLWSLHVDVVPGDRAEACRGPMRPVRVEVRAGGYVVEHECVACGSRRTTRSAAADDVDALARIAREYAEAATRGGGGATRHGRG